jgi:hypothetical protein
MAATDGKLTLVTADNVKVAPHLRLLYSHLHENHFIEALYGYRNECLGIFSNEVLTRIQRRDPSWENMVPEKSAQTIKRLRLFGWTAT